MAKGISGRTLKLRVLRQQAKTFNYVLRGVDAGIIVLSFVLAYGVVAWAIAPRSPSHPFVPIRDYLGIIILVVPIWIMGLKYQGAYESFRKRTYLEGAWQITRAILVGAIFLVPIVFVTTKSEEINILFISVMLLFSFTGNIFLILGRAGIMFIMHGIRKRGFNWRTVLIVGTGKRARGYAEAISFHKELGLSIAGFVDDQPTDHGRQVLAGKIIGKIRDVPSILEQKVIDEVVIALPCALLHTAAEVVEVCQETGIEVTIAADLFDTTVAKPRAVTLFGIPMISFSSASSQELQLLIKDCFDRVAALILIILTSPLLIAAAIAIKWTSQGPVIFKQVRCGLNGRTFPIYKLRTMVVDAEAQLEELQKYNTMSGPVFKMKDDPRLIPLGSFLRRTSIDELPQLFNVLRGEMSLVGPRPPLPAEISKYDRWQRRRLSVKPGMTCIWQVSGRNSIDFQRWMELDLGYIDNWSLWLDFQILLRTVVATLRRSGAC